MQLELTQEEQQMLLEILESRFGDLRMEIADTDNRHFREMLRRREEVLRRLIEKVRRAGEAGEVVRGSEK